MVKILILGTMQDAGIPQLDCLCVNCKRIRIIGKKFVSCIAVIGDRKAVIIDATPDLPSQFNFLKEYLKDKIGINGLLITHLHIGHYIGLPFFGRESANTKKFPIYLTKENFEFLQRNKPFSYLFERNELQQLIFNDGEEILLDNSTKIKPFSVPHRNEDGNTVGLEIINRINNKKAIYISDIDYLSDEVVKQLLSADKVLLDGTFFTKSEIMRQQDVPHPPISETIDRFGQQTEKKFYFIHLNHSNPLVDKTSKEYSLITEMNYQVANENLIIEF